MGTVGLFAANICDNLLHFSATREQASVRSVWQFARIDRKKVLMTQLDYFNRDELLEHAQLDAHGMLDEVDAARFSRGFARATPQLQAELIRLQAEASTSFDALSDDVPPTSLRLRTIARVIDAVEDAARPATIARIGRDAQPQSKGNAHETQRDHAVVEQLEAMRDSAARTAPAPLAQSFWRAAALFFAAALAVTLWFNASASENIRLLAGAVHSDRMRSEIAHLAPGFAGVDFNSATPILMSANSPTDNASAVLYVNSKSKTITLVAYGLREGATLVLRTRDESGSMQTVGTAVAVGGVCAASFADLPAFALGSFYELTDTKGEVLLRVRSNA